MEIKHATFSDVRTWISEAWGLFVRRWITFLVVSALFGVANLYTADYVITHISSGNTLWYDPLIVFYTLYVCIMIAIAFSADTGNPVFLHDILQSVRRHLLSIALLCLALILMNHLLGFMVQLMSQSTVLDKKADQIFANFDPSWLWTVLSINFVFSATYYLSTIMIGSWFFLPITLFFDYSRTESIKLAYLGFFRNKTIFLVLGLLPHLSLLTMLLFPEYCVIFILYYIAYPILMYVSWRHVYLGRLKNEAPVKVEQTQSAIVTS
jgi:hypothetical protein